MTTTHLRDRAGRPVGFGEVSSRADVSSAIIDGTFERRWVVDVGPDRLECRTCDGDECEHVRTVRRALAEHELLGGADVDGGSWRDLAALLAAHGVPERRAQVAALAAHGLGPTAIAERLGVASAGSIVNQLEAYREQREDAVWLAEHGPVV